MNIFIHIFFNILIHTASYLFICCFFSIEEPRDKKPESLREIARFTSSQRNEGRLGRPNRL